MIDCFLLVFAFWCIQEQLPDQADLTKIGSRINVNKPTLILVSGFCRFDLFINVVRLTYSTLPAALTINNDDSNYNVLTFLYCSLTMCVLQVSVANLQGVKTTALLTRMDTSLGNMVGNALEIAEVIECLRGVGPTPLVNLIQSLGKHYSMCRPVNQIKPEINKQTKQTNINMNKRTNA